MQCFTSSGPCSFDCLLVSWFFECHRLDKRNNDTLESFICSWCFSLSFRPYRFFFYASIVHRFGDRGIDPCRLAAFQWTPGKLFKQPVSVRRSYSMPCQFGSPKIVLEVVMNFLTASLPLVFLFNLETDLRERWGVLTILFLAYW